MQNAPGKLQQIKGLENGKGLQHLLNEAYKIFGNPILIHDMEYKAVGFTEGVTTDDPLWNEYKANGTVDISWLEFFKNECFLEAAANATMITFLTSDKLKYNRIYGKVINKNNLQIGCAVLTACDMPFDEDVPVLFEEMCHVLSVELGKSDFYTDYGQMYFEKLVDELIADVSDIALYTAHVASIYVHLKTNLYLTAVDVSRCDPAGAGLAYYRDLMKQTQPEYMYAVHANHILIFISTDDPMLYVEKHLHPLNALFAENDIYAGVSRSFENLFDLGKYYTEALGVLDSGPKTGGQRIFLYGQL